MQAAEWASAWQSQVRKLTARKLSVDKKDEAKQLTELAEARVAAVESILAEMKAPSADEAWAAVLGDTVFRVERPKEKPIPERRARPPQPEKPDSRVPPYRADIRWYHHLVLGETTRRRRAAADRLERANEEWRAACDSWRDGCERAEDAYQRRAAEVQQANVVANAQWDADRETFAVDLERRRASVATMKLDLEHAEPTAVTTFMDAVLGLAEYPEGFLQEWDLHYVQAAKTLIVDYRLPEPGAMPRVKEVRYVASRSEFVESLLSESQQSKLYDTALYQTALRLAWEVFTADVSKAVDAICINGLVRAINPATGLEVESCVLSLHVRREELLEVNLRAVSAKDCFKRFKGIASGKLSGLVAVAPIQKIDRRDARFVDGHAVLAGVDDGVNLAAMDWQDFEHLIRELFEREFSSDGSEVRVTQASRDGGVDAVVFDSDPIRGGKIVIQAKRYTGLVDVSAVRDLFGTVHNEGAIKGILVTTSNYGPDAHEFAKGKPLTLLNGGNLLHLLQKHGTRAHIDLRAAKAQLKAASQG